MKLGSHRLWIALASATGVVCAALVDFDRSSPGPLSAAHERDERLSSGASCKACHRAYRNRR